MSYFIVGGKIVRKYKTRRNPEREPIKTPYCHELWHTGPVARIARSIAREDLRKQLRKEGKDLNTLSDKELENGVTLLLFNSGDVYLHKAKEWLR